MDMSKVWKRENCQKKLWNDVHQEEENEVDLNLLGRKGLEDWWEKRDWLKKTGMTEATGEEDYMIVKWAQEDVETLYSLLNK
jgi:hypothetical protein